MGQPISKVPKEKSLRKEKIPVYGANPKKIYRGSGPTQKKLDLQKRML
jgi:hypothetical protein